jgi:hypothetical protein
MDPAFQYRVTKYNPRFRNRHGGYTLDDWICVSQIGDSFGGVVLTPERYEQVETAYATTAVAFMKEAGTPRLLALGVENHHENPSAPIEEAAVGVAALEDMIRRLLRGEFWCRLEAAESFIHIGYDYYMYVGAPRACEQSCSLARSAGLFVEPFLSPYRHQSG